MTTKHAGASVEVAKRMPVVFAGHGSPLNAIEDNRWSRGFAELGATLPRPRAVLAISAHWYINGCALTGNAQPRTIHDFGGFPPELYQVQYPARGSVELATRVQSLLGNDRAVLRSDWGLDHGTWSVLRWMFPEADVPVVQLSIDKRLSPDQHVALAKPLSALRSEDVLILGSGNITHNLGHALTQMHTDSPETPEWARKFDLLIADALAERNTSALLSTWPKDEIARLAHPTPDHWLPLLYAYAATDESDLVTFPITGFDFGSLSMRSIVFS